MSNSILTLEQIAHNAPAVFEDYPAITVNSRKYQMIHTKDILEPLDDLGWHCVSAQQRSTRKEEWTDKTYHVLRFRNENLRIGDDYLDLVIGNSHNASTSFKIQLGVYRLVCSNGLVVGQNIVSPLSIQHSGLSSVLVSMMAKMYAEMMCRYVEESISQMKNTLLTESGSKQLALQCAKLKHNEYEVNVNGLLVPKRYEDRSTDVWTTFNVIQEHIMAGDYQIKGENGDWRMARKISSPASAVEINAKMFELALEAA